MSVFEICGVGASNNRFLLGGKRYAGRHWHRRETRSLRGESYRSGAASMMTVPELAADALEAFLGSYIRRRFGSSQTLLVEIVPFAGGPVALLNIAVSSQRTTCATSALPDKRSSDIRLERRRLPAARKSRRADPRRRRHNGGADGRTPPRGRFQLDGRLRNSVQS
jgi:hypothetical protein